MKMLKAGVILFLILLIIISVFPFVLAEGNQTTTQPITTTAGQSCLPTFFTNLISKIPIVGNIIGFGNALCIATETYVGFGMIFIVFIAFLIAWKLGLLK